MQLINHYIHISICFEEFPRDFFLGLHLDSFPIYVAACTYTNYDGVVHECSIHGGITGFWNWFWRCVTLMPPAAPSRSTWHISLLCSIIFWPNWYLFKFLKIKLLKYLLNSTCCWRIPFPYDVGDQNQKSSSYGFVVAPLSLPPPPSLFLSPWSALEF